MRRILVTGGAGFPGSHLCERLIEDGHEVIPVDNRVSGRTRNLEEIFYHDQFSFYEHDVSEFIPVSDELDWVLHLASLASPVFYRDYQIKTLKVGALETHKTLGLAKEKDAEYLFTSTSEVYGDPDLTHSPRIIPGTSTHTDRDRVTTSPSVTGKQWPEHIRDGHDIDIHIARIFNTYGPRMRLDDGCVIPTSIQQAQSGEDLTVHGDGEQTRSFCYVLDLIDGLIALMESDIQTPVNIGNPDERTINELAQVVLDVTGSDSGITHEELPPQDPQVRRPDISKTQSELGWEPTVSLRDGLAKSIEYFEAQL